MSTILACPGDRRNRCILRQFQRPDPAPDRALPAAGSGPPGCVGWPGPRAPNYMHNIKLHESSQSRSYFLYLNTFDRIAFLIVIIALNVNTALESGTDLLNIIFEASKRIDLTLMNNASTTYQTRLTHTVYSTLRNHTAGNSAMFADVEHLADFGDTEFLFS